MSKKNEPTSIGEVSIFSSDLKIEGNVFSEGNVRIDGKILGNVNVKGNLTIGDSAELNGDITAKNVTVSGKIEGTINVIEKLVLEANSQLYGDIVTKILVVEAGAKFNGNSKVASSLQEENLHQINSNI